ncbi:hypothetical protein O59_001780 [Cellvibrio sp. BR]|nr:hypothetical protein O59_001780 [Cellvibrio sp. BR]
MIQQIKTILIPINLGKLKNISSTEASISISSSVVYRAS